MKKKLLTIMTLCCVSIGLTACGVEKEQDGVPSVEPNPITENVQNEENDGETQGTVQNESEEEQSSTESEQENGEQVILNDGGDAFFDAMDAFYGEYPYKDSSDGTEGTLSLIQELDHSREYSIYDYCKDGYRFIAMSWNVEYIRGNRMYLKYPETDQSGEETGIKYYIIEKQNDHCSLYETDDKYENPVQIYITEAAKQETDSE